MKRILFATLVIVMALVIMAPGPSITQPPPVETLPPPPIETQPPPVETRPVETQPPAIPTERGMPNPEPQEGPGKPKNDGKVISLPKSGYGPQEPAQSDTIALWCIAGLFLVGMMLVIFGFVVRGANKRLNDLSGTYDPGEQE